MKNDKKKLGFLEKTEGVKNTSNDLESTAGSATVPGELSVSLKALRKPKSPGWSSVQVKKSTISKLKLIANENDIAYTRLVNHILEQAIKNFSK